MLKEHVLITGCLLVAILPQPCAGTSGEPFRPTDKLETHGQHGAASRRGRGPAPLRTLSLTIRVARFAQLPRCQREKVVVVGSATRPSRAGLGKSI